MINLGGGGGGGVTNLDVTRLGVGGFVSLVLLLFSLLRHIEITFNRIWAVNKERNILTRFMHFWTILTLGTFIGSIAFGYLSSIDHFYSEHHLDNFLSPSFKKTLVSFFTSFICIFIVYKWVPNCYIRWRSACFGAFCWNNFISINFLSFSYYISMAANYQSLYGALAALPVFLLWLYLFWVVVLMGALASWRWQHGFVSKKDEYLPPFVEDPYKQMRIKTLLPLVLLLSIHKKFKDGDSSSLEGEVIYKKFKIPISWLQDAVQYLESQNLIVVSRNKQKQHEGSFFGLCFHPSMPSESIDISTLSTAILPGMNSLLKEWLGELSDEFIPILEGVKILASQNNSSKSLQELLKK